MSRKRRDRRRRTREGIREGEGGTRKRRRGGGGIGGGEGGKRRRKGGGGGEGRGEKGGGKTVQDVRRIRTLRVHLVFPRAVRNSLAAIATVNQQLSHLVSDLVDWRRERHRKMETDCVLYCKACAHQLMTNS